MVAEYLEIDIKQAKVELIRIFYGGNPRCNIPWLLALAHEVQTAANSILGHESSSKWLAHYADRANPEFSRLCSILSFLEADLLDVIRLRAHVQLDVAIFDGGYVPTSTLLEEIALKEACRICQEKFIPMEIKGFSSDVVSFTHGLFRQGVAQAQLSGLLVVGCASCLMNALAPLVVVPASFCIDDFRGAENQHGLSADDFNRLKMQVSQSEPGIVWQMMHIPLHALDPAEDSLHLCHEKTHCGRGHWWSFRLDSDGMLRIFDCTAKKYELSISLEDFLGEVEKCEDLTFFSLQGVPFSTALPNGPQYNLTGF